LRNTRENAVELSERLADRDALGAQLQLANRGFVNARSFLHDGDGFSHLAARLEEPQQDNRVGQVAQVNRHGHR
jgi:hypothetical protein